MCGVESELGGAIYSRPEVVAVNGISPASEYGGDVAGRLVQGLEHRLDGALIAFQCLTQHGRGGYDLSPTERPHGTSAAESAP